METDVVRDPHSEFEKELTALINKHNLERRVDSPDFIIAAYLVNCLRAMEDCVYATKRWREPELLKEDFPAAELDWEGDPCPKCGLNGSSAAMCTDTNCPSFLEVFGLDPI